MENKKQCTKCKEWKELSEFHNNKLYKDGLKYWCKECQKIYRKNNKEQIKKLNKQWRIKNKNKTQKYLYSLVLWNSEYPEKIKLYEKIRQNGEFLEVKCAYCGDWFRPTNLEVKNRLQAINGSGEGEARLYCSNNCKKECPIYNQNKYPKGYKKATSREVQPELRQMVLLRDNYTCQKCEKYKDELKVGLHCHHYEGIEINPIESADIDACITLCKICHKEVHKLPGCNMKRKKCS